MDKLPESERLTILHVATINKPITAQMGYGPIEAVIYNLDKGLHSLGHRSLVACSSDSEVVGEKVETVPHSFGDYWRGGSAAGEAHVDLHLSRALARVRVGDIDIIHMHEWFERVYAGGFETQVPIVMTLHVPGQHSGVEEFHRHHPDLGIHPEISFVAISAFQQHQYLDLLPVEATIPHGIDVEDYPFGKEELDNNEYLFSIGRITKAKGQDTAIAVAKRSGSKLVLAGCVQNKQEDLVFYEHLRQSIDLVVDVRHHPVEEDYFEKVMKPILSSNHQVIYIGELDTDMKKVWYQHARATLFPIRWGEPFGMVLIESMATGTPVLAFGEGAVSEIVRHGETGFVVDTVEAMVEAVEQIERIDRRACRRHVQTHFSIRAMAERYSALYQTLAKTPIFRPAESRWVTSLVGSPYIPEPSHERNSCQETSP